MLLFFVGLLSLVIGVAVLFLFLALQVVHCVLGTYFAVLVVQRSLKALQESGLSLSLVCVARMVTTYPASLLQYQLATIIIAVLVPRACDCPAVGDRFTNPQRCLPRAGKPGSQ